MTEFLTRQAVAIRLGVSVQRVTQLCNKGKLDRCWLDDGHVWITAASVESLEWARRYENIGQVPKVRTRSAMVAARKNRVSA